LCLIILLIGYFQKFVVDEKNCEEEGEEIADITEEEAE
jgi:hypothetical protein